MTAGKVTKTEGKPIASPPDTMAVAMSLAKAGWPVFPVNLVPVVKTDENGVVTRGTDKRPLVQWLEGATTDLEQIATWWGGQFSGAWVGVNCQRARLVVVDLDLAKTEDAPGGRDNLRAAGFELPKTLRYRTRSGGQHHLYRAPKDRQLTIGRDHPVKLVDIRAGHGLMVYYGPVLTEPPTLAKAPDWALIDGKVTAREADGDAALWLKRAADGVPPKGSPLKKLVKRTDWAGLTHEPMLEAVSDIIKRGNETGAATVFAEARAAYVKGRPDRERDWDNATAGSIGRHGLPPVTLELSKAERKAIAERNSPTAIDEAAARRKAEFRIAKIDERLDGKVTPGHRELTDAALAEEIAAALVDKWANVEGTGLLRYNGIIWQPVDEALLIETVRKRARVIRAEETKVAILRGDKKREDEARGIESRNRVVAIARFAAGILLDLAPKLDADPDLLNTPTGVVDLRTGKMRKRRPDDYMTKVTGAEYVPGATSRDWELALKALPKPVIEWLQVRFGQGASGRIPEDKGVPFLTGGGDNGKSVIVGGIRNALGTYAVTVPERLLLGNDNDHPTDIMTLEGARLALFEELPRGGRLNVNRLKLLSGTNRLSGRRMRQDFHEFNASHMLAGATNNLPLITDVDDATWSRVAPVKFPYKFVPPRNKATGEPGPRKGTNEREGEPGLRDRLGEVWSTPDPAVLAWLVDGAVKAYRDGMPHKPRRILDALEDWRGEADPVLGFTRDHLELSDSHAVVATDLYAEFGRYLESRGQQQWSDQLIATSFTDHSSLPGVVKRQVTFGAKMTPSRPPFTVKPVPPRPMAWVGIRFKNEGGTGAPMSPEVADLERRMHQ
jgi:putative DNA primase/helicase